MKICFLSLLFFITINSTFAQVSLFDRNKAVALINQASAEVKAQNYSPAIVKLKTAIKLDSSQRAAFTLINQAFYETGNRDSQVKYLNKAKSIYTDDDEFPYHLGKLYQKENNLEAAICEYNTAIKFSKINGEDYEIVYDYYANRGICFLKQNLYTEAVNDFDYAIKLNDMKGSIYANRGIALFQMKKKEEACKSWERALELGQSSVELYLTMYCK